MSEKLKAADLIERQARTFEAFITAAAELRKIGSLEQAAQEADEQAAKARKQASEATSELADAKAEIKKARDKADAVVVDANDKAKSIIAAAEIASDEMLDRADKSAGAIIANANAKADNLLAGVTVRKAELEYDITRLVQKRDELSVEMSAKTKQVEELEARLAKAQAQIAKLLG